MTKSNLTVPKQSKGNDPVLLVSDWLLQSGIQNTDADPKFRGGVNAWYDLKKQTFPFIYSEITGYAVSAFLFIHHVLKGPIYLERAQLAANWLLRSRDPKYGFVVNRVYHPSEEKPYYDSWIFTFDQWMIIDGLCNLSGVTGDRSYLHGAQEIADRLIQKTFRHDNYMYPAVNLENGQVEAANDKWSRQPGSFHAKVLLGLNRLFNLTHDQKYLTHAFRLAERACLDQKENGRFVTQINTGSTHLHPHCYTLEGILFFGLSQNRQSLIEASKKGLEWMLNSQHDDGTLYAFFQGDQFLPYERADILAQILRLSAIMLGYFPEFQKFKPQLERLKKKMLSYQIKEGPQKGGFLYGQEENGIIHDHANAWVSLFALQALWLYDQSQTHDFKYDFSFFA